jgi:hypothetical protein
LEASVKSRHSPRVSGITRIRKEDTARFDNQLVLTTAKARGSDYFRFMTQPSSAAADNSSCVLFYCPAHGASAQPAEAMTSCPNVKHSLEAEPSTLQSSDRRRTMPLMSKPLYAVGLLLLSLFFAFYSIAVFVPHHAMPWLPVAYVCFLPGLLCVIFGERARRRKRATSSFAFQRMTTIRRVISAEHLRNPLKNAVAGSTGVPLAPICYEKPSTILFTTWPSVSLRHKPPHLT